jgi:hypothetical protein
MQRVMRKRSVRLRGHPNWNILGSDNSCESGEVLDGALGGIWSVWPVEESFLGIFRNFYSISEMPLISQFHSIPGIELIFSGVGWNGNSAV